MTVDTNVHQPVQTPKSKPLSGVKAVIKVEIEEERAR
jgi:hypothetical protein